MRDRGIQLMNSWKNLGWPGQLNSLTHLFEKRDAGKPFRIAGDTMQGRLGNPDLFFCQAEILGPENLD